MGKSNDAGRGSSNDKVYVKSQRNNWDPREDYKLLYLGVHDNSPERNYIIKTPSDAKCKLL